MPQYNPVGNTPYDVLISYSHFDKSVMDAMCHFLEEQKIRCWYAPRDIRPGQEYAEAIEQAMDKVNIFILVCSSRSLKSKWVHKETNLAVSDEKIIIPFKIENCSLNGTGMKLYLNDRHWIDAVPDPNASFGKLAEAILAFLEMKRGATPQPSQDDSQEPELPKQKAKSAGVGRGGRAGKEDSEKRKRISTMEKSLRDNEATIQRLEKEVADLKSFIEILNRRMAGREEECRKVREQYISKMDNSISLSGIVIDSFIKTVTSPLSILGLSESKSSSDEETKRLKDEIMRYEDEMESRMKERDMYDAKLKELQEIIMRLQSENAGYTAEIKRLQNSADSDSADTPDNA